MKRIAVVGAGARCVTLLERFSSMSQALLRDVEIHIIDPTCSGAGVHSSSQSELLFTNTLSGEISLFRKGDAFADGDPIAGPTLAEWLGISPSEYARRRDLGAYLEYCYQTFSHECISKGVGGLIEHRGLAVKYRNTSNSQSRRHQIVLDTGESIYVDYVIIAQGHLRRRLSERDLSWLEFVRENLQANPNLGFVTNCYDLEGLRRIPKNARCGVMGLGLSAIDTIVQLTEGRGGRFKSDSSSDKLTYTASGEEPKITVFSRSGRLLWARGRDEKGVDRRYIAKYLTWDVIRGLISEKRELDFGKDIFPLLLKDMENAASEVGGENRVDESWLRKLVDAPESVQADLGSYLDFSKWDVKEAQKGNRSSEVKAATDVIRDLRDNIRALVEYNNLSESSKAQFFGYWAPRLNALAGGPPLIRVQQWQALVEARILDVLDFPTSEIVADASTNSFRLSSSSQQRTGVVRSFAFDTLVYGNIGLVSVEEAECEFIQSVLASGSLDANLLRASSGKTQSLGFEVTPWGSKPSPVPGSIFALGVVTEGSHFFTNVLPSPSGPARMTRDADLIVSTIVGRQPSGPLKESLSGVVV